MRASIGQHVKMFKQIRTIPGRIKDRAYPEQVTQEGDVQRYGVMKTIRKDETISVHTSKSQFWPDVTMLAAVDLDLMQSMSMAIGVQR